MKIANKMRLNSKWQVMCLFCLKQAKNRHYLRVMLSVAAVEIMDGCVLEIDDPVISGWFLFFFFPQLVTYLDLVIDTYRIS